MKKYLIGFLAGVMLSSSLVALAAVTGKFPDVASGTYYTEAVDAMATRGVITGYENGDFGPNDSVTRGQFATVLERYDNQLMKGYEYPLENGNTGYQYGMKEIVTILCSEGTTARQNMINDAERKAFDDVCQLP